VEVEALDLVGLEPEIFCIGFYHSQVKTGSWLTLDYSVVRISHYGDGALFRHRGTKRMLSAKLLPLLEQTSSESLDTYAESVLQKVAWDAIVLPLRRADSRLSRQCEIHWTSVAQPFFMPRTPL
jgi:hypothetical protein